MTAGERAAALLTSAYDLAAKQGTLDPEHFRRLALDKSFEIQEFLEEPGVLAELDKIQTGDRGPVSLLGRAYDDLAGNAADILKYLSPNPVWVGVASLAKDIIMPGAVVANAAEFYGGAVGDGLKAAGRPFAEAFRKARPWLIGAGVLGAAFAAAYVWRSFK